MDKHENFSHYTVHVFEVTNAENKKRLAISLSNSEDIYDGMYIAITPAEAKILSKAIYEGAREMEPKPLPREKKKGRKP